MHYRVFDCWRFAAALLVMAYHFLYYAPVSGEAGIAFLHRLLPLLDMFFMISGFLITDRYAGGMTSPADFRRFLQRRVARLYPLHIATLAFFVLIASAVAMGLIQTTEPARWDLSLLPFHLLAVHALGTTHVLAFNYVSWSVSAEFFCYLMFPLIILMARWKGLPGLLLLLGVWLAGLEIAGAQGVFPGGHWTEADTLGAYRGFADFIAGAIVASLAGGGRITTRSHGPGIICLGFAVTSMLLEWNHYLSLAGFAASMLFTAVAETRRPQSTAWLGPLMPVARVSFGIYLLHPVMEILFFSILWKRMLEPGGHISFYVFWLLPMLATLACAVLSERYFERRAGRLLSGLGAPRQPDSARMGQGAVR